MGEGLRGVREGSEPCQGGDGTWGRKAKEAGQQETGQGVAHCRGSGRAGDMHAAMREHEERQPSTANAPRCEQTCKLPSSPPAKLLLVVPLHTQST